MMNKLFSFFKINSFKQRLRFGLIFLIFLLVSLGSLPLLLLGKEYLKEEAEFRIKEMINLQQLVIENWFEERLSNVITTSQLPSVKLLNEDRTIEAFETINDNHPEFHAIVFINKDGITEIDTSGDTGIDLSDRIYFQEGKKGNTHITDVLIGRQSNQPIIIFSSPIYDYQETFQGIVFGAVTLDKLNEVMSQFQISSKRATYLVNKEGLLISDSRLEEKGTFIDHKVLSANFAEEDTKHTFIDNNGETLFWDYRYVNNNQWFIIGEIVVSEVYVLLYRLAWMLLAVVIVVIIIGFIFVFIISNQIESPIQKVLEGTRRVGKGEYHYRLDPYSYKEDTIELQELCDNFNKMSQLINTHVISLEKSEERFRLITNYSSDMITIHDINGKYQYVSPAGKDILQYEDDEIIGQNAYIFIHPDDHEQANQNHQILLDAQNVVSTYRIRRKDGEYIWFESAIRLVKGTGLTEPQLIAISRNITERKLVEEKLKAANELLQELSTKDGLTGAWNRRTFDEKMEYEWKQAFVHSNPISLLMLDIDNFKQYNDIYGHQGGDDSLIEVAKQTIQMIEQVGGYVCRYGGEEFAIILPNTDEKGAKEIAERVRAVIDERKVEHIGSDTYGYLTVSLGTSTMIPIGENNWKTLIEAADSALFQAKQTGKNCVRSANQIKKIS